MTMRIDLDPEAEQDLLEYLGHIAADNPVAARVQRDRIRAALEQLAENPAMGRHDRIEGVRRPLRSFAVPPLRIYYSVLAESLYVHRVYHQARRPISR